jgi:predicted permease
MEAIFRDIRYGIRSLIKSPGVTLFATLALTLGIGVTTTMFSIVYGALLKGLPYDDGARIVEVSRTNTARKEDRLSMPWVEYIDDREQQHSFTRMAAYTDGTMHVSGAGLPERYFGAWATASLFEVLPTPPLFGRTLTAGEDSPTGAKVVVIGYALWQKRFGGDRAALGQVLRVNAQPYTIVGVMPEGFRLPDNADLWLPMQDDPLVGKREAQREVTVIATLKPGVNAQRASLDMAAIAKGLETRYKETNEGIGAGAMAYTDAEIGPGPVKLLWAMLSAVFFVLLIACANVANALLERAAHRAKETSVRIALGATRAAVVRQFLTEALVLAMAGALLGTGVAYAGVRAFNTFLVDAQPPSWIDIGLHPPVLAFVIALSLLATLLSGALPALQSSRTDINEVLKDESRGSSGMRIGFVSRALVVGEIALSCGLLVASGLMIKSVTNLQRMDPGFQTANIFTARVGFPLGYTDTLMQARFYERLRERLLAMPGAQSAALMSGLPGVFNDEGNLMIDGVVYQKENDVPRVRFLSVSPGFFETFAVHALRGRLIDATDRAGGNDVLVVNQTFADKFFPGVDAIGRRVRQGGLQSKEPWMTIVGIVPTAYSGDTDHPRQAMYYQPLAQHHSNFVSMAVRTAAMPMALSTPVREAVAQLEADIPIYRVQSMEKAYAQPTWFIRVFGVMFMIFGGIALFLASIGLYAVMSFSVARRTREVGIRMALGAKGSQVVRLIFRQGLWQIALGIPIGFGLAVVVAYGSQVLLFDVQPLDPGIYAGVVAVLTLMGLTACFVPARRATRVDPMVALHSE